MNWQNIKQRKSQDIISYFYITFISINIFNNKIIPNTTLSARSPVHATFNKSKATQYTALVPGILCVLFRLHNKTNSNQVKNLKMNVRLLISFEKAFINDFTNTFITTLLGIFHQEIGKKRAFFTLRLGPIFGPKNEVGKSLKFIVLFHVSFIFILKFRRNRIMLFNATFNNISWRSVFFNNCNLLFLFCPCSYKISS